MITSTTQKRQIIKKARESWVLVVYTFNPSTQELEVGESMSLGPACYTEQVPGQAGLLERKTLFQKKEREKASKGGEEH